MSSAFGSSFARRRVRISFSYDAYPLTFTVQRAAGIISTRIARDLLQHQTLIRSNYSRRRIMCQMNTLKKRKEEDNEFLGEKDEDGDNIPEFAREFLVFLQHCRHLLRSPQFVGCCCVEFQQWTRRVNVVNIKFLETL